MVTVRRIDGPPAIFDPANALRLHRGTIPLSGSTPCCELDIDDPDPIVHSDQTVAQILSLLGPSAAMVDFTAPDGSPIHVNAKRVRDVEPATPEDDPKAQSVFFVGTLRQAVLEPPDVVRSAVGLTS